MWVFTYGIMAFKLTYTDGQESDYDDGTKWDVDGRSSQAGPRGRGVDGFRLPGSLGHDRDRQRQRNDKKDRRKTDKDEKDDKDDKDDD